MSKRSSAENMRVRQAADAKLREWGFKKENFDDYEALRAILGHPVGVSFAKSFTDEEYNTCLLLAGPNGYAIFKMICLKRGLTELQQNCADS